MNSMNFLFPSHRIEHWKVAENSFMAIVFKCFQFATKLFPDLKVTKIHKEDGSNRHATEQLLKE